MWFSKNVSPSDSSNANDNNNTTTPTDNQSNNDGVPYRGPSLSTKNPSLGLQAWGPLVPASDHKECVVLLASIQGGLAISAFVRAMKIKYPIKPVNSMTMFSQPRQHPKLSQVFLNVLLKAPLLGLAGVFILGSGVELGRMFLPYDPFYEEAMRFRKSRDASTDEMVLAGKFKQEDIFTSKLDQFFYYWHGPSDVLKIGLDDWLYRMKAWIMRRESEEKRQEETERKVVQTHQIYQKIREQNRKDFKEVMASPQSYEAYLLRLRTIDRETSNDTKPTSVDNNDNDNNNNNNNNNNNDDDDDRVIRIDGDKDQELFNDDFDTFWKRNVNPWIRLISETSCSLFTIPISPDYSYENSKKSDDSNNIQDINIPNDPILPIDGNQN
ncbi:hypothetical protein DASC09_015710 [Saccharomycopsis crataegensis]|uniref:Uncharacterized protein n=1 Tax=Saccharomycopsis crataegensis TaxID=43959 RepID=A0AAV5QI03_9ASCO|nr:hypothetical protein DASC09_015710 [Saccharomycopsis crataegensis]